MGSGVKGRADYWEPGDWNATCSMCGRKRKASTLVKNWKGQYRCPEHNEPREAQDFVRSVPDIVTPAWIQEEFTTSNFLVCTIPGITAIPFWAMPGCAIPSKVTPNLGPQPTTPSTPGATLPQTCATPIITPPAVGSYTSVTVTITCATLGSTIYYTTDGTTPNYSSSVFTAPFTIPNGTVTAFAAAPGYLASNVALMIYTSPLITVDAGPWPPVSAWSFLSPNGATQYYVSDYSGAPGIAGPTSAALNALPKNASTVIVIGFPFGNSPPGQQPTSSVSATLGGYTMQSAFASSPGNFGAGLTSTAAIFWLQLGPGINFPHADFVMNYGPSGYTGWGYVSVAYMNVLHNVNAVTPIGATTGASAPPSAGGSAGGFMASPFTISGTSGQAIMILGYGVGTNGSPASASITGGSTGTVYSAGNVGNNNSPYCYALTTLTQNTTYSVNASIPFHGGTGFTNSASDAAIAILFNHA